MLPLLVFGLLVVLSSCNLRENGAETIKQFHLCKKLANNGNCDVDCLGFDSFETDDCKDVEFEPKNYKIIVNAHPFMHSMESWKIVRETAEKRFYRVTLTIDITEEQYKNITNHCMKLIRESNFASSSAEEPSIFEYCPVEVNATFSIPQVQSQEFLDLCVECEKRDNNEICDPMCMGLKGKEYEETDCNMRLLDWDYEFVMVFFTKQDILRVRGIWHAEVDVLFRRKYNIAVTASHANRYDGDFDEASKRKYLAIHIFMHYDYSNNSMIPRIPHDAYVATISDVLGVYSENIDSFSTSTDIHL